MIEALISAGASLFVGVLAFVGVMITNSRVSDIEDLHKGNN